MKVKFLILLFLVAGEITAQTLLTGIVTDSLSKPIPGASVYLFEMAEERVGEALPFNYTPDSDVLKMSSRRDRKSTRTVKNNLSD